MPSAAALLYGRGRERQGTRAKDAHIAGMRETGGAVGPAGQTCPHSPLMMMPSWHERANESGLPHVTHEGICKENGRHRLHRDRCIFF